MREEHVAALKFAVVVMPLPAIAWIAGAVLGALALRAASAKPQAPALLLTLTPKLRTYRSRVVYQPMPYATSPAQIPADVLAAVASRILYAGAYDDRIPQLKKWANGGATAAEPHRGTITIWMWNGLAVGMDGFPFESTEFEKQNLRFNTIAVAVQNELARLEPLPAAAWAAIPMLRPLLQYPTRGIDTLSAPGQWLCYRYLQLVEGIGCDLWDEVWAQGHTTREIYSPSPSAAGANPEQCRDKEVARYEWLFRRLAKLRDDASYTEQQFVDELARQTLLLAKMKIVRWPGGPASSPYVDWGYIVGWLVRAFIAAEKGDVDELSELAQEAGDKSKEWAARPPEDDYGSAELAGDLERYAGDLASNV